MKSIKKLMAIGALLSFTACNAQIKNLKTEQVKIYGNCEMCEATIENAGNKKNVAKVDWNKDTKMATIEYDATLTSTDEVLKRIALSGYDNERFLAPKDVYAKLSECCQYKRTAQTAAKVAVTTDTLITIVNEDKSANKEVVQEAQQLKGVFDNYFALKDALVKTDGITASSKAKALRMAIQLVKMEKLTSEEHVVWMKVMESLANDASRIEATQDVAIQREYFISLSKSMYDLIKVSKTETPTYFLYCPMANDGKGANWLSKENVVKNPYYGSQMLTCGKVVETIK